MKKIYQTPKTEVMLIRMESMLTESVEKGGSYNGGAIESKGRRMLYEEEETNDEIEWDLGF